MYMALIQDSVLQNGNIIIIVLWITTQKCKMLYLKPIEQLNVNQNFKEKSSKHNSNEWKASFMLL